MDGNICRLCLKTIFANFQIIDDALKNALDTLLFKLNLNIPKNAMICNQCANNLQLLHNFKSACINMKDRTLLLTDLKNDCSMDLEKNGNMYNMKSDVESKYQMRCCFCTKIIGREGLISLNESKENMFVVDMLEERIPELKSNMRELLTCETCLDSVQGLLTFHINILNEIEKIRDNTEIGRVDNKEEMKLKYEHECNDVKEVGERFAMETKAEIKCQNERDNPELLIKTEDVDIKSGQSDGDSFLGVSPEFMMDTGKITLSQCEVSSVKYCKINHEKQELTQIREKDRSSSILVPEKQSHMLCHKDPSQITMYKCEMCKYKSKHKKVFANTC